MSWAGPEFVIAIIGISTIGWLVNNFIRARHGYPLEDEWGGKSDKAEHELADLRNKYTEQSDMLDHLKTRLITLERIVTDKGYDVATQIEALRPLPTLTDRSHAQ
ncbi:MAG: hypothetical protein RLY97_177 [Pseudomonadota bacterium]|jgi:hypothetical protein